MVGIIVLSFFGVVIALSGTLPWGEIIVGFIVPDVSLLWSPAESFIEYINGSSNGGYWTERITNDQRNRMIAAAATAVGINMTFLLPYSLLRRGWGRPERGLATLDLSIGLFIPFLLATSCVVIAAASQFHAKFDPEMVEQPIASISTNANKNMEARVRAEMGPAEFDKLDDEAKADAIGDLPLSVKRAAKAEATYRKNLETLIKKQPDGKLSGMDEAIGKFKKENPASKDKPLAPEKTAELSRMETEREAYVGTAFGPNSVFNRLLSDRRNIEDCPIIQILDMADQIILVEPLHDDDDDAFAAVV